MHSTIQSTYLRPNSAPQQNSGFTLVEIAVVLVIVGFILGSILGPLSSQQNNRNIKSTESLLDDIHDALLGFASLNGYLPCPASLTSNGLEDRAGTNADCNTQHGYVPSATLGLNGKFDNTTNLITDSWGNAIRYSLDDANSWEYAKTITMNAGPPAFDICESAGCGAGSVVADNVVAVVLSTGPQNDPTPNSNNQADNLDADDNFVDTTPSEASGSEFDHIVVWLSPNILSLHLVRSGQLGGG